MQKSILVVGVQPKSLVNFRGHLMKALIVKGYKVFAAADNIDGDQNSKKLLNQLGVETYNIPIARTGMNPIKDLLSIFFFIKAFRDLRPSIVLAYTTKPVIWGGIASLFFRNQKFIALITGLGFAFTGNHSFKRKILKTLIKILYGLGLKKANAIIFQNPDDKNDFKSSGLLKQDKPIYVVNGSGVSLEDFPFSKVSESKLNFLMISRLIGDKGVREYVEAGKILNKDNYVAHLHLVGSFDSNPDSMTKDEIKFWKELEWFTWHGPTNDVAPFIDKSSVYVLPSYREGTPRTVLEAMSMGRAIITSDAPGCRETVVPNKNGFLVQIKNPEELSKTMKKFVDSPSLVHSMGLQSRVIAENKYDVHKINKEMIKILES